MRIKILTMTAAAALLMMASCQDKEAYNISGTVKGAADGEYVYLRAYRGAEGFVPIDSSAVKDGKFSFSGTPDSLMLTPKAITYSGNGREYNTMVFLENGDITVSLNGDSTFVKGTPDNDAMNAFVTEYNRRSSAIEQVYREFMQNTNPSDFLRDSMEAAMGRMMKDTQDFIDGQIKTNISNAFGAYLLISMGNNMQIDDLAELLPKVKEPYASTKEVQQLKDYVDRTLKTAVGKKYVDFSMNNPEGKMVKLSDFVSKSRYTLIDFWASWCGPCRGEMVNIEKAYKKFKNKGFNIVSVSLDNDKETWLKAIKEMNMSWDHMSDLKGWQSEGAALYGIQGIPATVLVDKSGTIIARDLRGEALIKKLGELIK